MFAASVVAFVFVLVVWTGCQMVYGFEDLFGE